MQNLIILDRDGVINYDSNAFIKSPEEWIPIPDSLEAIAKLTRANYLVVVATNQSGIARGLYTEATLTLIHEKMLNAVQQEGGTIDKIFYCPHGPDDQCECRKPKPGLFHAIAVHYHCSLEGVVTIGDSLRDIEAALAVGSTPILIRANNKLAATNESIIQQKNIATFVNLAEAVDYVLSHPNKKPM